MLLAEVPDGYGILSTRLTAHGEHSHVVGVRAGGTTLPASATTLAERQHYFHMLGPQVWEYATTTLPLLVKDTLHAANLTPDDIDLVVMHQANLRLIEEVLSACGVSSDRAETCLLYTSPSPRD